MKKDEKKALKPSVSSIFALIFPFKFGTTVYGKAREGLKKSRQIFKAT